MSKLNDEWSALVLKHKFLSQAIAGGISGAITKTSVAPLDRVKILLQVQGMSSSFLETPKYKSVVGSMVTVIREEGFRALYKGNAANVIRIIPNYALKFSFNDSFRDIVAKPGQTISQFSFAQLFLSGTLSGLFTITLTYPLDVVRTRLALSESLSQNIKYKGIIDCFLHVVKTEGPGGLYKGIAPTWIAGIPNVAFQLSFYDVLKGLVPPHIAKSHDYLSKFLCGATAGLISQTLVFPGDTVRKRMQTNGIGGTEKLYNNTMDCFRKILYKEGVRGFYRGVSATVARTIPGTAIQFTCYDLCKKWLGLEPKE